MDNWEGNLPKDPSSLGDSNSLKHSGYPRMITTEASYNALTCWQLLASKGSYGTWDT